MASPIEHVFVLMLENRSFNHLFTYSGIPGLLGVLRVSVFPRLGARLEGIFLDQPDFAAILR